MFRLNKKEMSDSVVFYFLNIENYSEKFIQLMDSEICKIWNGDEDQESDIALVKLQIKNFINNKSEMQKHGIIAEFICHLFLRSIDYKQHFLFQNLEEASLKKGFDGLYKKNEEMWLFESKSTQNNNTSHEIKIKEAYTDLKAKIEDNSPNTGYNPWRNAYNHANSRSVHYDESILKTLRELSDQYSQNEFAKICDFNIMPSSTIYLGNDWIEINAEILSSRLQETISKYEYNKLNVICVNKKDINQFIKYING